MSQLAALIKKNQIDGACGWLDTIAKQCLDGQATNLHLDGPVGLITIGTHNRNVLQSGVDSLTLETAGTEYATKLENYCFQYDVWLSRWRDAAADVAAVGLDGSTILMHTEEMHARQAILLKKRTCSMCGKTAPNSSRAFAYCGGCRHASIPRVDRPRYCSEACQRAHWLAGHMHECPRQE